MGIWSLEFRVQGSGFRIQGSGFRVRPSSVSPEASGGFFSASISASACPKRLSPASPCCGSEAGSYLRLIDSCITQLKAQGPSGNCNESKEEDYFGLGLYQQVVSRQPLPPIWLHMVSFPLQRQRNCTKKQHVNLRMVSQPDRGRARLIFRPRPVPEGCLQPAPAVLNLRTTTSQNCAAVPRRARM